MRQLFILLNLAVCIEEKTIGMDLAGMNRTIKKLLGDEFYAEYIGDEKRLAAEIVSMIDAGLIENTEQMYRPTDMGWMHLRSHRLVKLIRRGHALAKQHHDK